MLLEIGTFLVLSVAADDEVDEEDKVWPGLGSQFARLLVALMP